MSSDLMLQVGEQASRPHPRPLCARLRQERCVRLEPGSYAVGRYDDVLALLHDPRVSSDPHTLTNPGDRLLPDTPPFITHTPPAVYQSGPAGPRPDAPGGHTLFRPPGQPRPGDRPGARDRPPDRHLDRRFPRVWGGRPGRRFRLPAAGGGDLPA